MSDVRPISEICNELKQLLLAPLSSPDNVFQIAEEIEGRPEAIKAVPDLLMLLEQNPEVDWGMPGPVVHTVEGISGDAYELLLLESIRRAPTPHTLWMLNRVINGVPEDVRNTYLAAMEEAAARPDASHQVREAAQMFLEFQREEA